MHSPHYATRQKRRKENHNEKVILQKCRIHSGMTKKDYANGNQYRPKRKISTKEMRDTIHDVN